MGKQPGKDLRIGDPERERAIALLGEHLTAGRLDISEYDQRCTAVARARFGSEISVVFEDLPGPRPELPTTAARTAQPARPGDRLVLGLCVAAGLLFLVLVTRQVWLLALVAVLAAVWFARRRS